MSQKRLYTRRTKLRYVLTIQRSFIIAATMFKTSNELERLLTPKIDIKNICFDIEFLDERRPT